MFADKERGPMRESYLESNWCVIESGTWRSGLFLWQIHKLSSKHALTVEIPAALPMLYCATNHDAYSSYGSWNCINWAYSSNSTVCSKQFSQMVKYRFSFSVCHAFSNGTMFTASWGSLIHHMWASLKTVGWKLNHYKGSGYWSQPLMAKQSAWHQTSVNLLLLVWTKYFSVSHIWMD